MRYWVPRRQAATGTYFVNTATIDQQTAASSVAPVSCGVDEARKSPENPTGSLCAVQQKVDANYFVIRKDLIHRVGDVVVRDINLVGHQLKLYMELDGQQIPVDEVCTVRDEFGPVRWQSDACLIRLAEVLSKDYTQGRVHKGTIFSSDRWSRELDYIAYWQKQENALGEEMEAAASAQIAAAYQIPYLCVRVVSNNEAAQKKFQAMVDAACVYVNAPTSFTDGAQFGLGAEIGISTQKLGARGPMALEEITTYKWLITGQGQTRA